MSRRRYVKEDVVGNLLPPLAAIALIVSALTGCVSRGEQPPSFPNPQPTTADGISLNPAGGPHGPRVGQMPEPPGAWDSLKTAMTENPVAKGVRSAGAATVSALTPKPHEKAAPDPTSLNSPSPKPNAAMFVSMAEVQLEGGNLEAAESLFRKALEQNKKYAPALVGLGQVRLRQQRADEAMQFFTRARAVAPDNLAAILGQAHYHDTRENMPEATRHYREATRLHPQSAAAWNDLGLCLARQRRLTDSQQALNRAVQLDSANILYRNNLATVLVEMNRRDEALAHLMHAHGPVAGHYNLGFLLHRRGDQQAAAVHFDQALRHDPNFEPARAWLDKIGGPTNGPQRAALPLHQRSAAILRGPDGQPLPLVASSHNTAYTIAAPPEIEHLAVDGPLEVVVDDLPSPAFEATPPVNTVSHTEDLVPPPVIEIIDAGLSDDVKSDHDGDEVTAEEGNLPLKASMLDDVGAKSEAIPAVLTPGEIALPAAEQSSRDFEEPARLPISLEQPEFARGEAVANETDRLVEPILPAPRMPQLQAVGAADVELSAPPLP